jgi:3-oxoacyl-[acyl-carrier protein] reductase
MKLNFDGKTILVTGGTRGIGKQIAEDLSSLGAKLLITGTHPEEIEELNADSNSKNANKKFYCLNFLKEGSLENFLEEISVIERVDCVVNNAGINRLNFIQEAQSQDWNDMVAVNLTAPFRIISALSSKMIENNYGRIVNIASIFSKISKEKRSVYSATKFGIHGLTVGASNDLASKNILVNTVSPGFVLTDLTKKNLTLIEMDALTNQIPSKRLANTTDISSVVVFLLSDLNQYLTGQNIIVDGGFTNV